MTYYKYQERDLESAVDWGVVGTSLAKDITDIADKRAKRKKDVEDNVLSIAQKIGEAPLGEHKSANQYSTEAYQQMGSAAHGMLKLLQKGKIDHNQFNRMMGNLNEGAELFGSVMTEYHSEYDAHLKAQQSGEEGAYGAFVMSDVEAYMNFSETAVRVGPDGRVVFAKYVTDKNGNRVLSDQFMSVNALRDRVKNRNRVFDVEGSISKQAGVLAKTYEKSVNEGIVRSMDDVRQSIGYDSAKKNYINSHLSNDFNTQSILTDFMMGDDSGEYYLTTDESKKNDPYAIFMEYDKQSGQPIPKPTKEQKKKASQALSDVFDTMVSRSLKLKQEFAPQRESAALIQLNRGEGQAENLFRNKVDMVGQLWWGDENKQSEAMDYFMGLDDRIASMKKTKDNNGRDVIEITLNDGNKEYLSLTNDDGTPKTQEGFIQSATILTGKENAGRPLDESMYKKDAVYSNVYTERTGRKKVSPKNEAKSYLSKNIPSDIFVDMNSQEAVGKLNAEASKFGYSVRVKENFIGADQIFSNDIELVDSEGNVWEFNTKQGDKEKAEQQKLAFIETITGLKDDVLKDIMSNINSESTPSGKKKLPGT